LEISRTEIVKASPSASPSESQRDSIISENLPPTRVEKNEITQEEEPLAPIGVEEEEKEEESLLAPEVSMSSLASDDEDEMIEEAFAGL
jgi:hypothetical protein